MFVRVENDSKMEVVVGGKGKPVLFISGFGFTALQWQEQFKNLTDKFMLISINYPGIGLSEDIKDFTYEGISNAFMKVLDLLGVQSSVNIIGSSWGGIIAQVIAKEFDHKVDKLILVGAFSEYKQNEDKSLRESLKDDFYNIGDYEGYEILQNSEYSNRNIIPKYNIYAKDNYSTDHGYRSII